MVTPYHYFIVLGDQHIMSTGRGRFEQWQRRNNGNTKQTAALHNGGNNRGERPLTTAISLA